MGWRIEGLGWQIKGLGWRVKGLGVRGREIRGLKGRRMEHAGTSPTEGRAGDVRGRGRDMQEREWDMKGT